MIWILLLKIEFYRSASLSRRGTMHPHHQDQFVYVHWTLTAICTIVYISIDHRCCCCLNALQLKARIEVMRTATWSFCGSSPGCPSGITSHIPESTAMQWSKGNVVIVKTSKFDGNDVVWEVAIDWGLCIFFGGTSHILRWTSQRISCALWSMPEGFHS